MSITQADLDTLRFPASALPAFDPMGLTAIATSDVFLWVHQDVIVGRPAGAQGVYHVAGDRAPIQWRQHPASGLWLTTEDPTTRFRVLRWIVDREWVLYEDNSGASMPQWQRVAARACWRLTWGRRVLEFLDEQTEPTPEATYMRVEGMGGLPYKPRALPDRSWFDDAAALRLAALQVAKRPYRPRLPHISISIT